MLGPVQYIALSFEDYKELEKQAKKFAETVHTSVEGFYHKSWRVKLPSGFVIEFVGPRVPAGYHQTENSFYTKKQAQDKWKELNKYARAKHKKRTKEYVDKSKEGYSEHMANIWRK